MTNENGRKAGKLENADIGEDNAQGKRENGVSLIGKRQTLADRSKQKRSSVASNSFSVTKSNKEQPFSNIKRRNSSAEHDKQLQKGAENTRSKFGRLETDS